MIEKPDDFLWPDMSARITFLESVDASAGGRAVLVPRSAGRTDADASFVWVVRDSRARRTSVTTGRDFGEQVQIATGLDGGETVVVGSPPPLSDGQAVATKS